MGTGLALLLAGLIFCCRLLAEEGSKPIEWLRGWIWPNEATGALNLGVVVDPTGLCVSLLILVLAVILLVTRPLVRDYACPERFHGAVGLAAAGAILSWISLTPWLALMGIALALLAAFLALGANWDSNEDSALAIRFGWERSWGMVLAILGGCGLVGTRSSLPLEGVWAIPAGTSVWDTVGAVLLVVGLMIQFQPFPFLDLALRPSKGTPWIRTALAQVVPAWAAFAILLRLEPQLRSLPVLSILGWVMLGSAVIGIVAGFLQSNWKSSFGVWVSCGLTLACSALFLAGQRPGLAIALGVGLGGCAVAGFSSLLLSGKKDRKANPANTAVRWIQAGCLLGICAGTGMIGFISAGGSLYWIWQEWSEQPVLAGVSIASFFLLVTLGWKVFWDLRGEVGESSFCEHWSSLISPFALVAAAMGWIWTGAISGEVIPGGADRVIPSLFDLFFGASKMPNGEDSAFMASLGFYAGSVVLGVAAAYWISGKLRVPAEDDHRFGARVFRFVAGGYAVEAGTTKFASGVVWLGNSSQRLMDEMLWRQTMPQALSVTVVRVGAVMSSIDDIIAAKTREFLGKATDLPVRLLQLIQNGDVQWYLFFAIGSGFAILVYFLRT